MIYNGGEKSPPFSFGPLAQLVRALPCHGRGRRFKSVMDRKLPSVLRGEILCYESQRISLESIDNVSGLCYNSLHDKVSEVHLGVHGRL